MAEETILLSKLINENNSDNHKVISLRKVAASQKKNDSLENKGEDEFLSLQMKIERSKKQLASLEQQKETLLQDVKDVIEKEKKDWQVQKKEEQEIAEKTGYKIGYDQGQEEALKAVQSQLVEANKIVDSATKDYHQTVAKHELAIIQLAIATAEKIIKTKIEEVPDHFTVIIQEAIKELKDRSQVTIYVSPGDYQFIILQKEELEQLLEDGELLSIYIDQHLSRGDCTIKHPFGQLDVGIDSQLQQIRLALEEKISEKT